MAASVAASSARVHQVPDATEAGRVSAALACPGDIVLALGTGPVAGVGEQLLTHLTALACA